MKTKVKRTYKIEGLKKSATSKMLRNAGFSIAYGDTVYTESLTKPEQIEAIASLCKTKRLVRTANAIRTESQDKYYPGWLKDKFAKVKTRRTTYAKTFAERWQSVYSSLYSSSRASVMIQHDTFNPASLTGKDWNAYSKSYGRPAVWKDAAVVIRNREFDIYNYREKKVGTFPIPSQKEISERIFDRPCQDSMIIGSPLLGGDFYVVQRSRNIYYRFDHNDKRLGYARLFKHPEKEMMYWEHGETLAECETERQHKVKLAAEKAMKERMRFEVARAKSLIMRLVKRASVTFQDARAVGYCAAGIKSFCNRTGIEFSEQATVPFGFLSRYPETQKLRDQIAEKLAIQILQKN